MILQKSEFKNQSTALKYYNALKLKSIAEPDYDFSNISVDFLMEWVECKCKI